MEIGRRIFLAQMGALAASASWAQAPVRIGLTPVFLDERSGFLEQLRAYLEGALQRTVVFVQRRRYADMVEQLLNGTLHASWLCGYPFVRYQRQLQLVAVPIYRGEPLYQAYIIAGPSIPMAEHFADLRGRVFAYSDPLSNSGYLFAQEQLRLFEASDVEYFRKSFFTFGHQNVIEAVSRGLADGGSVDGYVWDSLAALRPELTRGTRVVLKSGPFGFPPFVAPQSTDSQVVRGLRQALVGMRETESGKTLLAELRLDGFAAAQPSLYDSIAGMMRRLDV